ncbi:hypothetical protein CS063_09595 [Sporanaerobium hydrogeniformans]|uniref:Uncharacterized protein n=1 Tax=Sporanaerobium hydrogeniformans TaxID=3072179 RepID=A0AC61DD94_9FIRM|nr:ABC transporter permease [Sporanaerobium hydrogeniformans]PHV70547.1 hypothetical protein CS063_09595 [Sporanaerobium hydrogeniformans]
MNLKRLLRDLSHNKVKNISFILLIILSITVIIGFNRSMGSYIKAVNHFYDTHLAEDAQFTLQGEISKRKEAYLESHFKVLIEKSKSLDANLDKSSITKENKRVVRLIIQDKVLNQPTLIQGAPLSEKNDIWLDPKFAAANGYQVGDYIILLDIPFHIVGYGISPDYVYTLKNKNDMLNAPNTFGVGYITNEAYKKLESNRSITTTYSIKSQEGELNNLKKYLEKNTELLEFVLRKDNPRLNTVFNDAEGPKQMGIVIGTMLIMVVAFIISISIKNNITAESQTIGILYAQGFNKTELLSYYMLLPSLLIIIGLFVGYSCGIILSEVLIRFMEVQYTMPYVPLQNSSQLMFFGIILPFILTVLITYLSISNALSKTPLSLLRGQFSKNNVSFLEKKLTLKKLSFLSRFRIKDMAREWTSMLALILGGFIGVFILFTAFYFNDSIKGYINDLKNNLPYDSLYTFINPKDLNKYSKHGELTSLKNVKFSINGKEKSVPIQGIIPNSDFFNIPALNTLQGNEVLMTSSFKNKYKIEVGSFITLKDEMKAKEYIVSIVGIAPYDYGPYLFTSMWSFNQIFNLHEQSYNALFTHAPLNIPSKKLASKISHSETITSVTNMMDMMNVMIIILIICGIGILITVVYLLLHMIIDKSKINISMVKIFGYNDQEVSKLYLKGNFIFLFISFLVALPSGYLLTNYFFTNIFQDMQHYFMPVITLRSMGICLGILALSYLGAKLLLKKSVNRIALTEALKNRE